MRLPILLLLGLCACAPSYPEDTLGGLRQVSATLNVKGKGLTDFKVEVLPGETSMLVTVQSDPGFRTHIRRVYDPQRAQRFDAVTEAEGDYSSTNGGYLSPVVTLNWPRNGAEVLDEGRWRFEFGNVSSKDQYVAGEVRATALFKRDADLSSGTLRINIVYAGDTQEDADLQRAVDVAIEHWRALYDTVGLSLDIEFSTWDDDNLDPPIFATETDFIDIADAAKALSISIVLVPDLPDFEDVLGVAGDIPGPLTSTTRTAILISGGQSAGVDGAFNEQETRILGETMAHEVGHFLGLYHPVETDWDHWDNLDDTPECSGKNRCVSQMSDYMMFPFPVCGITACEPQLVVTGDQNDVMQGYVGVD